MSQIQLNNLLTILTLYWNQYSKQIFVAVLMVILLVSLADPNMTVLANGASSDVGATGG